MLSAYPGIGIVGTWLIIAAILMALGVTAASSGPDYKALLRPGWWLSSAIALARAWSCALAVFLIASSAFLFWFRVPRRPNDRTHLLVLTALLSIHAAMFFVKNAYRQYLAAENVAAAAGASACLAVWLVGLSKSGEVVGRSEFGSVDTVMFDEWNDEALSVLRSVKRR